MKSTFGPKTHPAPRTDASEHFKSLFNRVHETGGYAKRSYLKPAEEAIFLEFRDRIAGKKILDVGVGSGRTTPHLLQFGCDYTAVDYSRHMVEFCQGKFPAERFVCCDARDMTIFPDLSFNFILLSDSCIDCVGHLDRRKILAEVFRLSDHGGTVVICSFNRDNKRTTPYKEFSLRPQPGLRATLANYYHFLRSTCNWLKNRSLEVEELDYAVRTVPAHDFNCPCYHISKSVQAQQMASVGFVGIKVYDAAGSPQDVNTPDTSSGQIHYVGTKPLATS